MGFFSNIGELKEYRTKAYKNFVRDFSKHKNDKYKAVEYPTSNFRNNEFSVSLVSHFLFLYDEQLNYEFHKQTLQELIRITTQEIRIFPLVNLKGEKSDFVRKLRTDKKFEEFDFKIQEADYEFVKGGNELLKIDLGKEKI